MELDSIQFSVARVGASVEMQGATEKERLGSVKKRRAICLIATCVAGIVGLAAVQWRMSSSLLDAPFHQPFNLTNYQAALRAQAAVAQVQVVSDAEGVLTLSGWCQDSRKLTPFLEQLREAGMPYRDQVICEDTL